MKHILPCLVVASFLCTVRHTAHGAPDATPAPAKTNTVENAQVANDAIGNVTTGNFRSHTSHPDAQWFGDAGLGLFVHWGIASVKGINISWSMRDGLNGHPAQITPNDYFAMAKDFNPQHFDPDKILSAAKEAGFTYAVLTTRHHEGFALWPSAYGDFSTKNYMDGRDLVKEYVDACRRNGLKVGLYYSPPDWHFDRDYMNFSMRKDQPPLGPDLKPRTTTHTPEEQAAHTQAYAELVSGQLEELLTHYGKIDLLWFDGRIPGTNGEGVMPIERIRQLQPGIVLDGRFHGTGDFQTYERTLKTDKVAEGWAEYCNTWTDFWPYVKNAPYRAPGFIIGQYVKCRSLHINYLPDLGPMADGRLEDKAYEQLAVLRDWTKTNGEAVKGITPLPAGESANVPATARGQVRYLFALPKFKSDGANDHIFPEDQLPPQDATLTLNTTMGNPTDVKLLGGTALEFNYRNGVLTVQLPAAKRTPLVDVVRVEF